MAEPQVASYGSWKSPITPDVIVSDTIRLGQICIDGHDIYWNEGRPSEGGRNVIVKRTPDGHITDVNPPPFNARTRVHEYGGGEFIVDHGTIYFSNFADQRVYRVVSGSAPEPITPAEEMRYADYVVDRQRDRFICVREDHTFAGHEAINTLVGLALDGSGKSQVLVSGNDFYSSPCISPDGTRLAWLTWNHPNMPWDGTELWVGDLEADGTLSNSQRVAGGKEESLFQPEWSPEGVLHFVSDRTGWWNLYRLHNGHSEALHEMAAEFGLPQWVFGFSSYTFASSTRIICWYEADGIHHLGSLDTTSGQLTLIETPYTTIGGPKISDGHIVFVAGSPTQSSELVTLDLATSHIEIVRRSSKLEIDSGYLSVPQPIEFPTEHGQTAHAFFYPPRNRDYTAPAGELPPLLVHSHGGPTGATSSMLSLATQYWTSRGIAVLDVNYGGSTGYGRPYRQRLNGQWGIVDVDDCANGAKYLVEHGLVDGNRLAIAGGSAGGYTTLAALAFRDTFKAGASHFGLSELETFVKDTHKFESRYLDGLIGPYPQRLDLYFDRSPLNFTDRFSCPVIFFQGLEDKIVPPNQAEMMVEALKKKGLPVAYLPFEGEQHGFRRSENIKRSLDAELYFYSRVFGFPIADAVEPVHIDNL